MCISRATSTSPSGPFVDDSSAPFICPTAQGGAIDPSIFTTSSGTPWLLWKSDGDCCHRPTHIYSQQLSPDGLSTVGPPHELIGATQAWEGGLVEAPSMVQSGEHLLALLFRQPLGDAQLQHRDRRLPLRHRARAPSRSITPGTGARTAPTGRATEGRSSSRPGDLVWMVHHGLVPGQSGNYAERRLYVDLMVFPKKGLPKVAPRPAAAALAVEALYFGIPICPRNRTPPTSTCSTSSRGHSHA